MNDIPQLIEQIHQSNALQRQRECCPVDSQFPRQPKSHPWRYAAAAAVAVVLLGVGTALLFRPTQKQYAYTQNASGLRVYCENGCNADDVLSQLNEALHSLD